MSTAQKAVIGLGIAVIVAMGLFPPWQQQMSSGRLISRDYGFLLTAHPLFHINLGRLLVQWVIVAGLIAGIAALVGAKDLSDN
jgi:hypothetical protein